MVMDEVGLARLWRRRDGVASRRQLLDLGATPHDVRRMARRKELTAVHPGAYVNHTGRPTRAQLQWAAVLAVAPAALHRESALDAAGLGRDRPRSGSEPVHVMVHATRCPVAPEGVRVERVRHAVSWIHPSRRPPRATIEFASLKVASGRPETGAIAVLADVCRQGLTTPGRLLTTLEQLPRLPARSALVELLSDVASGVHSVLEHRYLSYVERPHGLPPGERQVRVDEGAGVVLRDVRYAGQHVLVELDGRFGHTDTDDRWQDLDRDLAAAAAGEVTVRRGWGQVLESCRVARTVGQILQLRGWQLAATPCGPTCPADRAGSGSPGDTDPTQSAPGA